jgi:hypothetical protein
VRADVMGCPSVQDRAAQQRFDFRVHGSFTNSPTGCSLSLARIMFNYSSNRRTCTYGGIGSVETVGALAATCLRLPRWHCLVWSSPGPRWHSGHCVHNHEPITNPLKLAGMQRSTRQSS